jgi:hypothetical protein
MQILKKAMRWATDADKVTGAVELEFLIETSHVHGHLYCNENGDDFRIPEGGQIVAWQQMLFSGEPFPVGTILRVSLEESWVECCLNDPAVIEEWDDDYEEGICVLVKVESVLLVKGGYYLKTEPVKLDMSNRFTPGDFHRSWLDVEDMLINSVNLYRDDPRFKKFRRWEVREEDDYLEDDD